MKDGPRIFPSGPAGETQRVQRGRLSASAAGGVVSFRVLGTKVARASPLGQKQTKNPTESITKPLRRPL